MSIAFLSEVHSANEEDQVVRQKVDQSPVLIAKLGDDYF